MSAGRGLKRKVADGVWYVRRAVPEELRPAFGGRRELVESLRTRDSQQVERRRDDVWRRWSGDFASARASSGGGLTAEAAGRAIERWRRARCAAASPHEIEPFFMTGKDVFYAVREVSFDAEAQTLVHNDPSDPRPIRSAEATARDFFKRHPQASRELGLPLSVGLLIGRLQRAEREPEGWLDIAGFDEALDAALLAAGVDVVLAPGVRLALRQQFASAWLEVARQEEAERWRAASYLAAVTPLASGEIVVARPSSFSPHEDDVVVAELIVRYRRDREARFGKESTDLKYNHIFEALAEALGPEKPI